ncbi:MAG: YdeI/OmpD-associated family protein [Candidatus Aminicenantaceae bacterium]
MKDRSELKVYEFDGQLKKHENLNATFIEFPYDVEKEFGTRGQVKILVRFDGVEYRGSLAKMGHHCHRVVVTQAIRKKISKQPGDMVHVALQMDDQPWEADIPAEFKEVLSADLNIAAFFDTLSYTHQKEYARWIAEAKKEETRQRRLNEAVEMLRNKMKHP